MPATLTPDALDRAAARHITARPLSHPEREAWAGITAGIDRTAPASTAARQLLTRTVDELVDEALRAVPVHGTRPPIDVHLPGRLAAVLPDWAHRGRRRNYSHPPSTQLYVAATILREWGWQAKPHHLRNRRGQRCICGALITTVALGIGDDDTAEIAASHILAELRTRGWNALIGDWNQAPGRTAQQAIDLTLAGYQRALNAGR